MTIFHLNIYIIIFREISRDQHKAEIKLNFSLFENS